MSPVTKRVLRPSGAAVLSCLFASLAMAAPPKVVKATPDNGQKGVDPATKQIRVVFDQPMDQRGFSWVGGGEKFPKTIGQPRWLNDRTCVLAVRLEPNHDYWLSINSSTFTNFRNKSGEPAEPYPIAFTTRAGNGNAGVAKDDAAEKLTPEKNRQAIGELKKAIDEDYSYRDLHKLDWDKLFKAAAPKLEAAKTPLQFAQETAKLLAPNKDLHLWLMVDNEQVPTFRRSVRPNYGTTSLSKLVPGFTKRSGIVATGQFPDGIAYILIGSWPGDKADQLKPAFDALAELNGSKGLIVDVRPNGGGAEPLAQQFAGCFIDRSKVYGKDVIRRNGEFSDILERKFSPTEGRPKYRGQAAVLTGPAVMSSCESFLLMMKQVPNCKLIGEKSCGSSGNPHPVELSNGVTVYVPSWKDLRMDGTCFEGEGIAPDIEIKAPPAVFEQADPVLAAALKWLREGTTTRPAK